MLLKTIVPLAILVVCVVLAVLNVIKSKKSGGCCGCDCGCGCEDCESKKNQTKE